MRQIVFLDFEGTVDAAAQFLDALAVDVEADHRGAGARESDRHRQTDIAEPNHGNLALMRQNEIPGWARREPEEVVLSLAFTAWPGNSDSAARLRRCHHR